MTARPNALIRTFALAAILSLAAAPATSQAPAPQAPATQASAPAAAPQLSAEQQLAQLNAEQAATARLQLDKNLANQKAYDDAVKARDAEIARAQAEYAAKNARVQAEYQAAMLKWQENAAACKARDKKRCVPAK